MQSLVQFTLMQDALRRNKTPFELLLESKYNNKGLISQIYTILQNLEDLKDPPVLARWNNDCSKIITRDDCNFTSSSFMISTNLLTIKLSSLKLIHRWYLTPVRVVHFNSGASKLCWKGCGIIADFIHCWWNCSRLRGFFC